MDRDVSLKPRTRGTPLQLNKNTLLSQTPILSPNFKTEPKNNDKEEYHIDAEEFLAKQKDNGNYIMGQNSKFNLLSHNFDENYNTNKDLTSQDNSFQIDGNNYFKGIPKDFDENFKIDANELFSQRLHNSNEMIGKQFNFEDEKDPFAYRFDKITDNSGSQDSYRKVKGK